MLEILNRYSHGLASIPVLHALRERGCLARLAETVPVSAEELAREFSANRAYLDVALRTLVCLDWIRPVADGRYEATPGLASANAIPDRIMDLYRFPFDRYVRDGAGECLEPWLEQSEQRWNCDHPWLPDYLDGLLIVPLLLALRAQGTLTIADENETGPAAALRLNVDPVVGRAVERLFVAKGWAVRCGDGLELNRAGRFIIDRIFITATLASYRPMFERAQELLFGDAAAVFARDAAGHETHVDRTINVIGSGFQHEKYFAALSDLVVRCFDGDDFASQPKYIVDMGAGDGTLLRRLYETVRERTRRGQALDAHPLIPVAADFNEQALAEASRTLAGIEHIAVRGDIGDPLALVDTLRASGVVEVDRVLHVRSFLDHDRPYRPPEDRASAERRSRVSDRDVYIDPEGHPIPQGDVIQSTVEHLRRWSPLVNAHGLVMLEVHCLPPDSDRPVSRRVRKLPFRRVSRVVTPIFAGRADIPCLCGRGRPVLPGRPRPWVPQDAALYAHQPQPLRAAAVSRPSRASRRSPGAGAVERGLGASADREPTRAKRFRRSRLPRASVPSVSSCSRAKVV